MNNFFLEYRNFYYNGSMKNIIITATAESVEQAQALIDAGVDRIYVVKRLRITVPQTLSYDEINRIAQLVYCWQKN